MSQAREHVMRPRPERYHPREVCLATLFCLHRDFVFEDLITSDEIERKELIGFRFRRQDGVAINYFYPIQDVEFKGYTLPTLRSWLTHYDSLNRVKDNGITIVPLCQVDHREHYNTLVFYKNNVYLIEPHSNNLTLRLRYPVEENIASVIRELRPGCEFHNLKIGQQPFYDDKNCGAHQINYSEIISHVPPDVLENPGKLCRFLSTGDLNRRHRDGNYIAQLESEPQAQKKDKQKRENFEFEFEDIQVPEDEKKSGEPLFERSFHASVQRKIHRESKTDLSSIISLLQKYNNNHAEQTFTLFRGHTRQKTTQALINILQTLSQRKLDDEKNRATALLYAAFLSITTLSSKLRNQLSHALALLLDCEVEYNVIVSKYSDDIDRNLPLTSLFFTRINLSGNQAEIRRLTKLFTEISEIDDSFLYKLSARKRAEYDDLRVNKIAEIEKIVLPPRQLFRNSN